MVIIGAGGFAKELVDIFQQKGTTDSIVFYDDVNFNKNDMVFNRFPILRNEMQVKHYFQQNGNQFTIGIGNPALRHKLYKKFIELGGLFTSVISPKACIGSFETTMGIGCNILDGATFSNCTTIGMGCIVYYNAMITHDCVLGNFVQISTGVSILGAVVIDDFVLIGANATILPKLKIGKNAVIAAGSVITKNVPNYALMIGNPARRAGWISANGEKLLFGNDGYAYCVASGEKYRLQTDLVTKVTEIE